MIKTCCPTIGDGGASAGGLSSDFAITEDTTMYVDGDTGNNDNDGSSWAKAKKTLGFLRHKITGDSDSIARIINATLLIHCRGTILSDTDARHTIIEGFFGSGTIDIRGESTDIQTDIVVTGQDNSTSSIAHHSYLDASAESWTPDEFKGKILQITTGTGFGSQNEYPILGNTATRIETIGLPDTDGTTRFKIISATKLKGATVLDPGTLVDYTGTADGAFGVIDCNVFVNFTRFDLTDMINGKQEFSFNGIDNKVTFIICSLMEDIIINAISSIEFSRCYADLNTNRFLRITNYSKVKFNGSIIDSSDSSGLGILAVDGGTADIEDCRFYDLLSAIAGNIFGSVFINKRVLIDECASGVTGNGVAVSFAPTGSGNYINFRNVVQAINSAGAKFIIGNAVTFQGSGVTTELLVSNKAGDVATFDDLNNQRTVQNTTTGFAILYLNSSTLQAIQNPEYDDLDTGLGALNFQDVVSKLYAKLITTALTGTVTVSADSDAVVGIGTLFTSELSVGQAIMIASEIRTVDSIGDDLNLVLSSNHIAGAAGATAYEE